jgi:hypothetical protein
MIKSIESMGAWMLGKIVPTVAASAGCPPDPYCKLCGTCYFKRCSQSLGCKEYCGSCGYNCFAASGVQSISLC